MTPEYVFCEIDDPVYVYVYVYVYGLVILCPDAGNLALLLLDRVRLENNHKTNIHILHTILGMYCQVGVLLSIQQSVSTLFHLRR